MYIHTALYPLHCGIVHHTKQILHFALIQIDCLFNVKSISQLRTLQTASVKRHSLISAT